MARRGENIRKRSDGRWEGRYKDNRRVVGKAVYHSVYGKTYTEVKEKLILQRTFLDSRQPETGEGVCFGTAADQWLESIKQNRKHSTFIKYDTIYRKYLDTTLSGVPVANINDILVKEILNCYKEDQTLSDSLQKSIYCVINQILSFAAICCQCPSITVHRDKHRKNEKPTRVLSRAEQSSLLKFLYQELDSSKLGIILCISTGLRLGEICALKWSEIDFTQNTLTVNRTVQRIAFENDKTKTILLETAPKSVFSQREIPISKHLLRLLSGINPKEGYYLCGSKPMEPRTYQNHFKNYLKQAGIRDCNFHILRHTFATNCIDSGMDAKSLSEILGHSDVQITLNRYVHPTMETKRKYLNSLSAIYSQYCGQIT